MNTHQLAEGVVDLIADRGDSDDHNQPEHGIERHGWHNSNGEMRI
jgi:hypothetical protein